MNRTALSVIALAVGSVLIIGLFNIYKPQTKKLANKVFGKAQTSLHSTSMNEHHYDGLSYIDHGNGDIEFTHGILTRAVTDKWQTYTADNDYHGLTNDEAPKDLKEAKSIKFDNVDASQAHNLSGMFAKTPTLQSVDFGDNFHPSNVTASSGGWSNGGMTCMFIHDTNLKHVNFGSNFKANNLPNNYLWHMFFDTPQLKKSGITGSVSNNIQQKIDLYTNNPYAED